MAIVSSLLTLCIVVALLLLRRFYFDQPLYFFIMLRYRKKRNMVKIDHNNDYGMYYTSDGERLDEGICEAVDTNVYYG